MSVPLRRPASNDDLFVWVLHRFAEEFEEHAVLKGGIALRLYDCPRSTTDIDYVFVPYRSKKDVEKSIARVLRELPDAQIEVATHSKMIRATIGLDKARIQIEANVSMSCASTPMSTADYAMRHGQPPRIIRMMAPDVALAHKLAAWNERRLVRDLYDVWFLSTRIGAKTDLGTLEGRLNHIESRIPALRRRTKMTRREFATELRTAASALDQAQIQEGLAPLLPSEDLIGLLPRIRNAIGKVADTLESSV